MNETVMTKTKPTVKVKTVLRALALFCIVVVFCPVFLVSCSGQTEKISVMTAVEGVRAYGEQLIKPQPILLVTLLLPAAVLVMLCLKKFVGQDKKLGQITAVCMAADTVVWIIFRAAARDLAEKNYCTLKTTGWYTLNMIAMIANLVLAVLVVIRKLQMDTDLLGLATGPRTEAALHRASDAVSGLSRQAAQAVGAAAERMAERQPAQEVVGHCARCGNAITRGSRFCTACGAPVPPEAVPAAPETPEPPTTEV